MPASIDFPTINGLDYGYSSLAMQISGIPFFITGVKDVSYKDTLKPGKGRGTNAQVKRRSRGQYDADGSLTFYKSAWGVFFAAFQAQAALLGLGYKELPFFMTANYSETNGFLPTGVTTDYIKEVRITEDSDTHSEDDGVLVHKCTLDIIQVNWNGKAPFPSATYPDDL